MRRAGVTRFVLEPEVESRLAAAGIEVAWDGVEDWPGAADEVPAVVARRQREKAEPAPPPEPTKVVPLPTGRPRAVVMGFDPASQAKGRDRFGRSIVEAHDDGVVIVVAAGVMPRRDEAGKPLTMRGQAEVALDLAAEVRRHYAVVGAPDLPVWFACDGRGIGISFLESLRALADPETARRFVVDIQASGQAKGRRWPPTREPTTRFLQWSISTEWLVESTNAAAERAALVVAPNLGEGELERLLRERSKFKAKTLPSGRIRFEAPGRAGDDTLTAVLLAALVGRNCVPKRRPAVPHDAFVRQMSEKVG